MGRNHFVMDTKGYCLFCLKLCPTNDKGQVDKEADNDDQIAPTLFSLQRFSHYLRLSRKKIFNDVISVSLASLPVLNKSELKGVLCEECSQLTETISEITLEMEVMQMTLDSCLFKIHDKINDVGKNMKLKEQFKLEMLNNPQTLLHFGIVEQLQKEVQNKCSSRLRKAQPRVILKKCDTQKQVTSRNSFPSNAETKTVVPSSAVSENEEEPQLCESTPINSSVQGGYHSKTKTNMEMLDPLSDRPTTLPTPTVPPNLKRQCKFCLRTFQTHPQKRDHERAIHQGIKFDCGFCPATFTIRSSVNRHRKQFHKFGRRPFKIEVEPPAPSQSSHFQSGGILEAMLSGPNPPPATHIPNSLECRICHKIFGNSKVRLQHERIHLGLQFPCDLCSVKFNRKSNMLAHRKRVHKELVREPVPVQIANDESNAVQDGNQFGSIKETELKEFEELPLQIEINTLEGNSGDPLALSSPVKRWQCRICHKRFCRPSKLVLHEKTIHQGLRFHCGLCSSTFMHRHNLRHHQKTFHGKVLNWQEGMRKNNVQHHEPIPGTSSSTTTTATPSESSSLERSNPIRSFATWFPEGSTPPTTSLAGTPTPLAGPPPSVQRRSFPCRICNKTFQKSCVRTQHEKIHLGLQIPCDLCSSMFTRRNNMLAHRKRAHKELIGNQAVGEVGPQPLVQFEHVASSSPSTGRLPQSKIKLKRFECRTCHKTFSRNILMIKHERSAHQGLRYYCNLCPAVFTLQCNLYRHKRQMHHQGRANATALQFNIGNSERIELHNEGTDQLPNFLPEGDHMEDNAGGEGGTESNSFQCQHCTKAFKSLTSLRQHLTMIHNYRANERKFECEYCGKRFIRNNILASHRRSLHLGKRYSCSLCSREFTQMRSMRNHMKTTCPKRTQP